MLGVRHPRTAILATAIVMLALSILTFVYSRAHFLIAGPVITLDGSWNTSRKTESAFNVRGVIKNASAVHLNGRKIFLNDRMEINESLILLDGYNIIRLRAEDRFGRITERTMEVVLAPDTRELLSEDHS